MIYKRRSKRRSKRRLKRSIRRSKRRSKRKFGTTITLPDGSILTPISNISTKQTNLAVERERKYIKYLNTLKTKLLQVNSKVQKQAKENNFVLTIGSFLLLLLILVYTSYDDIKDKSVNELLYSTYSYLIGGSILGQHAIKDAFYKIIGAIKDKFDHDAEHEEIIKNFKKLSNAGLIDDEKLSLFNALLAEYRFHTDKKDTTKREYVNSFLQLVIDLTPSKNMDTSLLNTALPDDFIKSVADNLEKFIKDYGVAAKPLEKQLINPLLLNMIEPHGPPISAIFLSGNPGVGKTRFVEELAKIFKGKIYKYEYKSSDRKRGSTSFNLYQMSKSASEAYSNFSVFTQMALDAKNTNKPMILFFDEVDKHMDSDILDIFLNLLGDPKTRKIKDDVLDIDVDIPNKIVIVCASNMTLKQIAIEDKKYQPLISRFVQIFIPDLTKEIQHKVLLEYIKQIHPILTPEDEQFVRDVVYRTNFPGMRELFNVINTYVSNLKAIETLSKFKTMDDASVYRKEILDDLAKEQKIADETADKIVKDTGIGYQNYDQNSGSN